MLGEEGAWRVVPRGSAHDEVVYGRLVEVLLRGGVPAARGLGRLVFLSACVVGAWR